jgi:hypothetical protein
LLLVEQGNDTIISTDVLQKVGTHFDVSEWMWCAKHTLGTVNVIYDYS